LAESSQFQTSHGEQVSTTLPTTNNEWEIVVIYCTDGCITWFPWVVAAIVVSSLLVACLAYTIFSQKQQHGDALAEKQAQMISNATEAANKEREFNDYIAHEVRNPLAAALSASSFVSALVNEEEPLVNQESRSVVRGDVRIIESSLHFINDLLRSMLDLHRAQSNQLILELVPTDIKLDILDPVAAMLYHRDALFKVEVDCPDNLILSVDRLRLKQVVLNLARNSTKFVEKGFVRLSADPGDSSGLCIYVEDSGPGIPFEKREKLFSRFQESLDELSQGTGIGLSLCNKLVDLMGGSIVLDDSYHSGIEGMPGAKLAIQIKCDVSHIDDVSLTEGSSEDEEAVVEEEDLDLTLSSSKSSVDDDITVLPEHLRVLFVDDDVVLRKLFFRSLKRIRPNWTLKEAASGESALRRAEEENFDIIFMDQYMMSVDKQLLGTETVRKLRSMGVNCLICGLSANDMEEPFKRAGADAFILKPFPCKPGPLTQELLRVFK
jgi:signal transduction histidine kinase/CheY-like chemotaxis protein